MIKRNNKKAACLLMALFVLISTGINAQKFELGIRLMPGFNSFDIKTSNGGTIKGDVSVGFGAAALAAVNITNSVGIQAELQYNTMTQKFKGVNRDQKIKLTYVSVPLLLSLNTNKTKKINFNMVLGPQLGFNAGSSITTSNNNGVDNTQAVLSVKKNDIGLAYGAGFDFALNDAKTFRLGAGYRGVTGLMNISDKSNSIDVNSYYVLDHPRINSHAVYLGISFLFL